MALQMARALTTYGAQGQIGQIVSFTLVRELGPVLTALLVAGRNASGIASELGSMQVTEQIDAMRALGTDPIQKLVTPRLIAMAVVLPLLTIIADFIGLVGGYLIACYHAEHHRLAVLDLGLAGPGIQRSGAGAAEAVSCSPSSSRWWDASTACAPPAARRAWAAPPPRRWSLPPSGFSW